MSPSPTRTGTAAALLLACLVQPLGTGSAGAADGWQAPRALTEADGVVGASGTDVVLADWVSGTDAGSAKSLRLQRSTNDGATFTRVATAPAGPAPASAQAHEAVVFGDAVALVVSRTEDGSGRATRVDRHEAAAGWSTPVLLRRQGCSPADGRAVAATTGLTIVVADECGVWRSTDGGSQFDEVAAPAAGARVQSLVATTSGFALLYDAVPSGGSTPRLFASASRDDGQSFAAPVALTSAEQVGSTRAVHDLRSGALVAATHVRPSGSTLRLEVRRSTDGGQTWSAPNALNEGPASAAGAEGFPPLPAATESGLDLVAPKYTSSGARSWLRWTSTNGGQSWTAGPAPADVPGEASGGDRPASSAGGALAHLLRLGSYTRTSGAGNGTDPNAAVPPTLTLNPAVISAGQATTVTYKGTPGSTVDILSRTQPATAFSKIGTVTLGPDGRGTSTHRPQKNTRITARTASGQLSETAPVIAVRSVASFNASRVGTRTYTFTGKVYPALRNRLVSLYRNGALAAQGRCDANGVYTITKTLAGGTATFQVRTADDQDNLGTRSRELSISVR